MHRIDTPDAVANLFSDGDPPNGIPATYIDAAWANAVQENIVRVILLAGIGLVKGTHTQLYDAILSLIVAAITAHEADPDPHPQYLLDADLVTAAAAHFVRYSAAQALTTAQQAQARDNI